MSKVTMSKKDVIVHEIAQFPEPLLEEILDFVIFIKRKVSRELVETAIASESSLKKDWLKPEEEKAWQDL